MHEDRPNPEELLEAIKREEKREIIGRLKIFLGMSAGVGKTYSMLESAHKLVEDGINVVVGIVHTHGRQETAQLIEGLKIIPEKTIVYKGTAFSELDLDAILQMKPQVVLIDELAHTNIPGSRHPKRWQDVVEILENGIDVYTTLNVQHIESLKDVVENITGITIHETVPDMIIQKATSIELVDITPDELLQRLKEGKVYLGDKSQIAARNFFQEDRLMALRELVLRYAAEKVDYDLQGMMSTVQRAAGWKPREKLLVAVSHSPHSQKLIRITRRLAFNLDARWIAIHVDDGKFLSDEDKQMLDKNLALARDLGAEVITTSAPDIAQAIQKTVRQKGVTQIIIGRPPKRTFFNFFQPFTLLDRIARELSDIDIHVIRQSLPIKLLGRKTPFFRFPQQISSYVWSALSVLVITLINLALLPVIGYKVAGFIFLIGILSLSLFFRKGPIFFASILYALVWNFFFIEPIFTFQISANEDRALLCLYLLTAIITGVLVDRARINKDMLSKREESAQALFEIASTIASSPSSELILQSVKNKLGSILDGRCEILIKGLDDNIAFDSRSFLVKDPKEKATATWVFQNGQEAGWSTSTLPAEQNLYLPLKGYEEVIGVLAYRPRTDRTLTIQEKNFLYTACQLLANHLEQSFTEDRKRKLEQSHQIEKVYQSILNFISHQFHNPLYTIKNAINQLKEVKDIKSAVLGSQPIHHLVSSSDDLLRLIDNISALSKLNAGEIPINKEQNDIRELVEVCCSNVEKVLGNRKLDVEYQDDLPLVSFDFPLIELLLCNLLFNSIENSPDDSTINIDVKKKDDHLVLSLSDESKGFPQEMLDVTPETFPTLPEASVQGVALGLAIAKTIAIKHNGTLKMNPRESGGMTYILTLPISANENQKK